MNLVKVENNLIQLQEEALVKLRAFNEAKKEMEEVEKKLKEAMVVAMEDYEVKQFENDIVKITYIAPTTKIVVDTKALKEEGLFELYSKESKVKSSVRITWKQ